MRDALGRRAFLGRTLSGVVAAAMARAAAAQQDPRQTMSGPMDQTAYVPVRREPRPGVPPKVSIADRDAIESRLKCGCRCPLDVYTCRTTDFTCSVSPRMHADVEALIAGGYDPEEITAAFIETWGERVLTAPKPQGFNLLAYVAPFAGLAIGGTIAAVLIRRWMRPVAQPETAGRIPQVAASAEELARLDAAVRDDE